jgi:diguanylate cyclase (GGDEF)-like protein/putative nucleotidyltransferase with HDIG domain
VRPRLILGISVALVILVGGLIAGGLMAYDRNERAQEAARAESARAKENIRAELQSAMSLTAGFRVVYQRRDRSDDRDFYSLAGAAMRPGPVAWLAWAPLVPTAGIDAFEERNDLTVWGLGTAHGSGAPGDHHFPARLVAPRVAESSVGGSDFVTSAEGAAAIERAVAAGEPRMSATFTTPDGTEVALLMEPVFREGAPATTPLQRRDALRGIVVAAIDIEGVSDVGSGAAVADAGPSPTVEAAVTDDGLVSAAGRAWDVSVADGTAEIGVPLLLALTGAILAGAVIALTLADRHRERYAGRKVAEALSGRRVVEEQLRTERNRAEALRELAESLVDAAAAEGAVLGAAAAARIADAFSASGAGIVRFDDDDVVVPFGTTGETPQAAPASWERVRRLSRPASAVDAEGARAAASPVLVDGRVWGAAWVASAEGLLAEGAEADLRPFADLVGLGIADAEARRQLLREATTDAQTGLANLRTFREHLEQQIAQARRHGRDLALVILDVDRFKRVNDTFGHQAGDAVLAEVARRLRVAARDSDVVARVGGEEFAWLMPEVGRLEAWAAADRGRAAISADVFPGVGRVTISAGVADLALARDGEELYRNADQALYLAKRYGRDIVFLHQSNEVTAIASEDPAEASHGRAEVAHLQVLAHKVADRGQLGRDHPTRVAATASAVARELGWSEDRVALLEQAALLHDVGMAAVPASVELDSSGPLATPAHTMIAAHPREGAQMVATALPAEVADWVRGHHERWDGGGYPDGLSGERISEGARILAVAETWDALTTDRPYRPALTRDEALGEMREGSGSQFWPPAVDALARALAHLPERDAHPSRTG